MFHQPSDPSLLDTVVYGLVKGKKNNFNVWPYNMTII